MSGCVLLALLQCNAVCASAMALLNSLVEHQAHAYLYPAYLYLAPCAPALALVDQAVAALILPSNNIELAGGVHLPC